MKTVDLAGRQKCPLQCYPGISLGVGDTKGDGIPDLVIGVSNLRRKILLALGNGDGTFSIPTLLPINPTSAFHIALADLNGDGRPDLVVSGTSLNFMPAVSILLGAGDGTFGPETKYRSLEGSILIADLNHDGKLDLVTDTGTILFGDGKGAFPSRADFTFPGVPMRIADIDRDGNPDLIFGPGAPSFLTPGFNTAAKLQVIFGIGNGDFLAPRLSLAFDTNTNFPLLASVDLTGDGIPDAILANNGSGISILKGDRSGRFTETFHYGYPSDPIGAHAMAVADMNGDGKPDIFVADAGGGNTSARLLLFYGNGDGTLAPPAQLPWSGAKLWSVAAADLNRDGKLDIIVGGDNSVVVYLSSDGSFSVPLSFPIAETTPASIAVFDFNGDNIPDLAIAGSVSKSLLLFRGKGDGSFTSAGSILAYVPSINAKGVSIGPGLVLAKDVNNDGRVDLVTTFGNPISGDSGDGLGVFLGNADGTFGSLRLTLGCQATFALADFDANGTVDAVCASSLFSGNGDGTFVPQTGGGSNSTTADLNGDGKPDILTLVNNFGIASTLNVSLPVTPLTIVSAASLVPGPFAPGAIAAAFGSGFTNGTFSTASLVLPLEFPGVTVQVQDSAGVKRPAGMYYASPTQINFVIPPGTAVGTATVTVNSTGTNSHQTAALTIANAAPTLFTVGPTSAAGYVIHVTPAGQSIQFVTAGIPISVTNNDAYLILFGTGFDIPGQVSLNAQGMLLPIYYSGTANSFPGLDQINALLPRSLAGAGLVNIVVSSGSSSNEVQVLIQ